MLGALMGALLMTMIVNGLVLMGATVQQQIVVQGIIIVVAVAVSQRQPAVVDRMSRGTKPLLRVSELRKTFRRPACA